VRTFRFPLVLFGAAVFFLAAGAAQAGGPTSTLSALQASGCNLSVTYTWSGWHNVQTAVVTISDDDGDSTSVPIPTNGSGTDQLTFSVGSAAVLHVFTAQAWLVRNGKVVSKSQQNTSSTFNCT
jgi:hypothetical protein